jgi:hypothetical protein
MKIISTSVAACMIAASLLQSPSSQALSGLIMVNPGVALVGALVFGAGIVTNKVTDGGEFPILLVGIVLLDSKTGEISAQPISAEQASKLGVSQDDALTYNSEVDQVNSITQRISSETQALQTKDNNSELKAFAESSWSQDQKFLSPGTLRVLTKIRDAAGK